MDIDYYEVTTELDAREILRYLNNLGIHNISGEVLKYFITDLKKLIKYDLQNRSKSSGSQESHDVQGPERLHSASTFSSRVRSKGSNEAALSCSRECQRPRRFPTVRDIHSAPNMGLSKVDDIPLRRACSCVRVAKKPEVIVKDKLTIANSKNLIKVPIQPPKKKCDPVSLYHYYTSLWAKYKPNVPGENDWSELRWSVRQKMAGNITKQIVNKVPDTQSKEKVKVLTKQL